VSLNVRACGMSASGCAPPVEWKGDTCEMWARCSFAQRTTVLRKARSTLAACAIELAELISPGLQRNRVDTLTAEVLPLLDACKFLERESAHVLRTRRVGPWGRPFWLRGVRAEIRRVPVGHVLVIGPSNFPLFLPGVQVLQALAAGNRVTWKPGLGGESVARKVAEVLQSAGLPSGLLRVTDESLDASEEALRRGADKVVLTGSFGTGQAVLRELAKTATPAAVELSGSDAVFVLPGADLHTVAKAVAFGLRLNGGEVCMSPRRLFADRATMSALRPLLETELRAVEPVTLKPTVAAQLESLVEQGISAGAKIVGELNPAAQRPMLVLGTSAEMEVAQSDVFAPVLALLEAPTLLEAAQLYARCPRALTASVFCGKSEMGVAHSLATTLKAGVVLLNDLIAPTADARLPFGGRGASGYGVTRGAEGLLEMTAVKTVIVRHGGTMRHLEVTKDTDTPLIAAVIRAVHGGGPRERWAGVRELMRIGRR
jgi:acyl-CoA reductase-like NAD-dependent aldehyde dehydrogenase